MEFIKDVGRSAVCFEYNGKKYTMTRDEIEAAYRYQEHKYLLEDAERQLDIFIFGYEVDDPDNLTELEQDDAEYFLNRYGLTYEDAKKYTEAFVDKFESSFDCNSDENSTWDNSIRWVLQDLKQQSSS